RTLAAGHRVAAWIGAPSQPRHELQWQNAWAEGSPVSSTWTAPQKQWLSRFSVAIGNPPSRLCERSPGCVRPDATTIRSKSRESVAGGGQGRPLGPSAVHTGASAGSTLRRPSRVPGRSFPRQRPPAAGTMMPRMTGSREGRWQQRSEVAATRASGSISTLLEVALAAASDDLQWPVFLEALSSQLRASTMSLFLSDPVSQRSSIQFAVGKDPSYVKAYNDHFATVSPFFGDWSPERWREGVIELSGEVCPDRVLLRTEYYNDWLRPQKIHHLARGVVAREGEASWVLSFGRPQRSGYFTVRERALFREILPGLRGALRLRHHLSVARSEGAAASAAFDALRIGVIFLDRRDTAIRINRRAQAILDAADGLKLERGTLSASCSTDTARLRRLIGQA